MRTVRSVLLATAVVSHALSAHAAPSVASQSASQPSEAEKETARSLMDKGDALVAQSDWEAALQHYRAAHQIMRVPTTGIEVARVQSKLGLFVEARTTAIEVANLPLVGQEPAVFSQARAAAAELADELESRIPSVVVEVAPRDIAPQVYIDRVALPVAAIGLPFKVNPGRHQIKASATGYVPMEMEFSVAEGERRNVPLTLVLDPAQTPVAAPVANPMSSDTGASEHSGPPRVSDETTDGSTTRGFIALGVAGAAGLVGGGAGIYSWLKVNEAQDAHCDGDRCTSAARPLLDDATTSAWVANVGLGVAVVALAYGVYELVFNTSTQSTSSESHNTSTKASGKDTARATAVTFRPHQDGATMWLSGAF